MLVYSWLLDVPTETPSNYCQLILPYWNVASLLFLELADDTWEQNAISSRQSWGGVNKYPLQSVSVIEREGYCAPRLPPFTFVCA